MEGAGASAWHGARHELEKRVAVIVGQGRLTEVQGEQLLGVVRAFVEGDAIEIVARRFYEHIEATARRSAADGIAKLRITLGREDRP